MPFDRTTPVAGGRSNPYVIDLARGSDRPIAPRRIRKQRTRSPNRTDGGHRFSDLVHAETDRPIDQPGDLDLSTEVVRGGDPILLPRPNGSADDHLATGSHRTPPFSISDG